MGLVEGEKAEKENEKRKKDAKAKGAMMGSEYGKRSERGSIEGIA